MEIVYIMVEPSLPENIGSAARAIYTMGFDTLRLVNPPNFPHEKAFHVAHGSREILEKAGIFPTLESALLDIDFSIATSIKKRSVRQDYHHLDRLPQILNEKKKSVNRVAIIFGAEESGLSNYQVGLCDIISFVPLKKKYPSLNLSHAIMLYAYTLSKFSRSHTKQPKNAPEGKYQRMVKLAEAVMQDIRFRKDSNIYSRIYERLALLGDDDINLVLSFLDKLQKKKTESTEIPE